jgi:hypothetical protein
MGLEPLTSLTSKERILIYLGDYLHMDDRYELPPDVIQETIAYCSGVQRKHLSQYLDDLIKEGCVVERKAHIKGMKQRMNGYYLTSAGFVKAGALRDVIAQIQVPVKVNGETKVMRVCDVDDSTSVHITLCDIIREAIKCDTIDMSSFDQLEENRREALETKEKASDTYRRALETAWKDGRVTATERFLVEELRKHLNITDGQHRVLEQEILKHIALDHMEFLRIYRSVVEVALADGLLDGPEVEILENLRRIFRISRLEHDDLLKDIKFEIYGPSRSQLDGVNRES